jgi:hypothetical protein
VLELEQAAWRLWSAVLHHAPEMCSCSVPRVDSTHTQGSAGAGACVMILIVVIMSQCVHGS